MNTTYSTIIIGSGAVGRAAAYHLTQKNHAVLLLEQFELGHDRGSSHGAARITRHSYVSPVYCSLMPEAFRAWAELEAAAGEDLFLRTGGLTIAPPDEVERIAENLRSIDVSFTRLSGSEVGRRFAPFSAADTDEAIFEPSAGALFAERILEAEHRLAAQSGFLTVKEQTAVHRLDLDGERPVVVTATEQYRCEHVVIAAGSWAAKLLPRLDTLLTPTKQQVLYFEPNDRSRFSPERFPVFIVHTDGRSFYGMPELLGSGVKVALHHGPEVDPDRFDRGLDAEYEQDVRAFLHSYLPELSEQKLIAAETCLYTTAPQDHFMVGPLPEHPRVILASACSGHGFKLSILTGRCVADLVLDGESAVRSDCWMVPE